MKKKKVSFVNPNFQQGPREKNAWYLPYSVGVIWAYASKFEHISQNYELGEFIWNRVPVSKAIEQLKDSDIVGFSTYIWNKRFNEAVAKGLKKLNPNIIILEGGPEPPITDKKYFKKYPHIDVCVKQEGEITFKRLLEHYMNPAESSLQDIPGIIFNQDGQMIDTGPGQRIDNLDEIPSPYLTGVFDKLIADNPGVTWNATLETNRGCPYACTFCDWGSLTYNKVKKFNLERVFAELEWIGQLGCDFISVTDANFGMFPERDGLIADKLVEVQKKYGKLRNYTMSWAKNQKREVVDIIKRLVYDGKLIPGLNLSVQTMNEDVLDIIKRKNLEVHKIEEVFDMCEEYSIPLYTEVILGLPGETLDSWKENFYILFKMGNHTGITIFQAQLLENAEMNLLQRVDYGIESTTVHDYIIGTYAENELKEGIDVVVATNSMPRNDMIDAQVFSWFITTFHIDGITNYVSRLLYKKYGIEYREFYDKLFNYIQTDEWLSNEIKRIRQFYIKWTTEGAIEHPLIMGKVEIHGWNLVHSTIITLHAEGKHSHVLKVVENFVKETYDMEDGLFKDLMYLQSKYFLDPKDLNQYPMKINVSHDILGYVQGDKDLYKPATYTFDVLEDKNMSLQTFCEQLFFARRRNFGKAWILDNAANK